LAVLPTYNERENIVQLVDELLSKYPDLFVCVVDDNSPDQTAKAVSDFQSKCNTEKQNRIHLIVRTKKDGRGGAVRAGFSWGLQHPYVRFEHFVEMDCDFSHSPDELKNGLALLEHADIALGSRYPNGKVIGWPLKRKALSFCANLLARTLISTTIGDYTSGYRCYTRKATELLCKAQQRHKGYIYLSEALAHLMENGLKVAEFPITFVNRERGVSNTSAKEVMDSLYGIFEIGIRHRFPARESRPQNGASS
jgi:dolichol-phosphate mannosyltransferase